MTVTCKVGISRFFSEQWVYVATMVWGMPVIDQTRIAKAALNESIQKIVACETPLREELYQISTKVRQMDKAAMKSAMINHLKRSRHLRQQLNVMHSKKSALQQHLDTLSSSELNQQVISSVKQTSTALKSMGLDVAQQQADGLLIDMEECMQDMKSIQATLSTPAFDANECDVMGLEKELDMLLGDSFDEIAEIDSDLLRTVKSRADSAAKDLPTSTPTADAEVRTGTTHVQSYKEAVQAPVLQDCKNEDDQTTGLQAGTHEGQFASN